MRIFKDLAELKAAKGEHLGYTEWRTVSQEQVNQFADATDDHQWIHVDVEKAKSGPFGGTIAHGYLSLALLPSFMTELFRVGGLKMGINYGLNKVRFPSPVPVGSRIRAGAEILDVKGTPSGTLSILRLTVEVEGAKRPACVAESLSLYVPADDDPSPESATSSE
ncbi:acyl dehydratase [Thermocatellispora tengchongensis]|uniref:Acyl dehydratase n=1 Tax=Thermocatellispora tengchongensis TaxID=1073253 RepID=A0A840P058_9ACTN|nr:MaoC family dehydratase [Thermocatellispora tengchongensis]MBB5130820.1 acyl dehydratase [Thermocatellispora tengchongensis]